MPLLIGILKLNRVLLLPKVPPQLEMFSAKYPEFAVYFNILKPVFYLIFGSHLIACLFSFSLLVIVFKGIFHIKNFQGRAYREL